MYEEFEPVHSQCHQCQAQLNDQKKVTICFVLDLDHLSNIHNSVDKKNLSHSYGTTPLHI